MPSFDGAALGRSAAGGCAPAARPRIVDGRSVSGSGDPVRIGETRSARYVTQPGDCVRLGGPGPEWTDKPPVVASYVLIRLCEQYCMAVLLETMPRGYCSVGSGQHLNHRGPIAIGAEIETTVRCAEAAGLRSRWDVTVRDAHSVVGEGWMTFALVEKAGFEARHVAPKYDMLTRSAAGNTYSAGSTGT
ncbi:hotdog domain-containing protein [Amycolatopsis sp. NPDC058986]|uniref:thioesterase, FlK family n=1 Tax=unclassified Amycolatopsis TaxID=2618356 RepID=UPI00366C8F9E